MKYKIFASLQSVIVLGLLLGLTACEGEFRGRALSNKNIINSPYTMKIANLPMGLMLVVSNTNSRTMTIAGRPTLHTAGSIQFFSLGNPNLPTRNDSLTIEVPSNVNDFAFDNGGNTLFVADPTESDSAIAIYEYTGGIYTPKLDAATNDPLRIRVSENPKALQYFVGEATGPLAGKNVLAVLSQNEATIQFFVHENGTLTIAPQNNPPSTYDAVALERGGYGSRFYMDPRPHKYDCSQ